MSWKNHALVYTWHIYLGKIRLVDDFFIPILLVDVTPRPLLMQVNLGQQRLHVCLVRALDELVFVI